MASPGSRDHIGLNVRRLRKAAGLTQAELSEAAEIADATLSRIERGRLIPSVELADRLATALRVSVDELMSRPKRATKPRQRPCEARLLATVRDLDDAQVDDITRGVRLIMAAARRTGGPARRPKGRS